MADGLGRVLVGGAGGVVGAVDLGGKGLVGWRWVGEDGKRVGFLEKCLLDSWGLDEVVAGEVFDEFAVGGARASPRHFGWVWWGLEREGCLGLVEE